MSRELLSVRDVLRLKQPSWLADFLVPARSLGMLWGPSNVGKSFVTVDLACSIAAGVDWMDQSVEQGQVVYVANEGVHSFKRRLKAWLIDHSLEDDAIDGQLWFPSWPVQILKGVDGFIAMVRRHEPKLVIFDTLAASAIGVEEDSVAGVGPIIDAALKIRRELECAVLFVHHTGWSEAHERGSSSIRAALDLSIEMSGEKKWEYDLKKVRRFLRCVKQRDSEKFSDITMRLSEVRWQGRSGPQKSLVTRRTN